MSYTRVHYVPVAERPHLFLAAVVVFQLGPVGGTKAENPSSIVVHFQHEGEGEDLGKIIPIKKFLYAYDVG